MRWGSFSVGLVVGLMAVGGLALLWRREGRRGRWAQAGVPFFAAVLGAASVLGGTWLTLDSQRDSQENLLEAQTASQRLSFAEDRDLRGDEQRRPLYERFRGEWFNLVGGWVGYLNCLGLSGRGGCTGTLATVDLARANLWRSYHDVLVYGTEDAIGAAAGLLAFVSIDRETELASWGGADRMADASFGSEAPFIAAYEDFLRAMCIDTSADPEACVEDIDVVNLGVVSADLDAAVANAQDGIGGGDAGDLGDFLTNELPPVNVVPPRDPIAIQPGDPVTIQPVPLDQPPGDGDAPPEVGGDVGVDDPVFGDAPPSEDPGTLSGDQTIS